MEVLPQQPRNLLTLSQGLHEGSQALDFLCIRLGHFQVLGHSLQSTLLRKLASLPHPAPQVSNSHLDCWAAISPFSPLTGTEGPSCAHTKAAPQGPGCLTAQHSSIYAEMHKSVG